jgi:hypothetical protein
MSLDVSQLRGQFPILARTQRGKVSKLLRQHDIKLKNAALEINTPAMFRIHDMYQRSEQTAPAKRGRRLHLLESDLLRRR